MSLYVFIKTSSVPHFDSTVALVYSSIMSLKTVISACSKKVLSL